jgi:preprotein translocase subunit SecA
MLGALAKRFFGSANDRIVQSLYVIVDEINSYEEALKALSDDALRAKTDYFREQLKLGKTLDDILPEAFAVVREASRRVLHMRHFDVQMLGGIVLHRGMISEMKTGEGKTLVATLPVYLNALAGKGVHVVTVNDYLVQRDAAWMGRLYNFLGLSIGCIINKIDDDARRIAYHSDITYGTNNEFGFDYLRDNMKFSLEERVSRPFNYAIVDEVDSILIDEARTPLIISGPAEDSSELYIKIDALIPQLAKSDYEVDEKARSVVLTEQGTETMEKLLKGTGFLEEDGNLYDIAAISLVHHVNQALRAHHLFTRDVDYIVKDHKVMIIDEFTGRMMDGRRYSEGLHQALEAKEHVPVQNENQTLASITFQNYFRMYPKLAGMTGTAMTEADEFADIYKLEVVAIPTNQPVTRIDENDAIYRNAKEKHDAIIALVEERHKAKQPMLVGTISIEKSEELSRLLKAKNIPHNVLNARYHEQEAQIIAQAGRAGAVTIATNMAGRGTDIMLGGNPEMLIAEKTADITDEASKQEITERIEAEARKEKEVAREAGGLFVIATERHESRRIDNQLRGRSGRQGDPGHTQFFLSLEDDLMRIFGSDRIGGLLDKLGFTEGECINHPMITKALEKAQKKVEAHNFDMRKSILRFDDVMNDQRKVIYEQRIELMEAEDISETVASMREETNSVLVEKHIPIGTYAEQWDVDALQKEIFRVYGLHLPAADWAKEEGIADAEILERIEQATATLMQEKEARYGAEIMRMLEKRVLLLSLDQLWKDHLLSLDHLRQGINLRAYAQKDPLNEYKREAFLMFQDMLGELRDMVTMRLAHMELSVNNQNAEALAEARPPVSRHIQEGRVDPAVHAEGFSGPTATITAIRGHVEPEERNPGDAATWGKVGRNENCPCGSGKKYKQCHGVLE